MPSLSYLRVIALAWTCLAVPGTRSEAGQGTESENRPEKPTVVRFQENPIIRPEMFSGQDGANICDPSLIRVPDWLEKPLGKYYLYFADHKGGYIRLAHADRLQGPWTIYEPGTLRLRDVQAAAGNDPSRGGHVSSPDVHVDDDKKEIRMYFHGDIGGWGHKSGVALSKDGIHFEPRSETIGEPYMRVFRRDGYYYAITRSGSLVRSRDGLADFETGSTSFADAVGHKTLGKDDDEKEKKEDDDKPNGPAMRHTALKLDGDLLTVFFSRSGDLPESIMLATADLTGDWKTWKLSPPVKVMEPERDYEGANVAPKAPTNPEMRKLPRRMFRELRDPCIYQEGEKTYLLYSVAGERGIAIAELKE